MKAEYNGAKKQIVIYTKYGHDNIQINKKHSLVLKVKQIELN